MDFAKIVELLDKHGASFVSVTQHFNTTNSMGRLTLNVLLSFAQFEREVTSERIRDKIAASKKKGMWMGGFAPMGYDIIDQRLTVNKDEAEVVENIFSEYLTVDSVSDLKASLDKNDVRTKSWETASGKIINGVPFSRGRLYHLLKNPLYIGQISHKGQTYKGHHEAIIPKPLWDRVQTRLKDQWGERETSGNRKSPCWLVSALVDEQGNSFQSTQTKKERRLYYYYTSKKAGWSLPGKEIERTIVEGLLRELRDPIRASELSGQTGLTPGHLQGVQAAIKTLRLKLARPGEAPRLKPIFRRIRVTRHVVEADVDAMMLSQLLGLPLDDIMLDTVNTVKLPVQLKRRGIESRIVFNDESPVLNRDENLVRLIAKSHVWFEQLRNGEQPSIEAIAKAEKINPSDVSRALPLAFLAPSIVTAILEGKQPVDLTAEKLRRMTPLPTEWNEQRQALGF